MDYRKLWEDNFGPIPKDEDGRPYEIHHIDGNRDNNDLTNLVCVSIQDHYNIHYEQGDFMACLIMSKRMSLSYEETMRIKRLAMKKRDQSGEKNPMWGKSTSAIVKEVWTGRDAQYRKLFGDKVSKTRKQLGSAAGKKNPMYGRSAVAEKKLKWYNDGTKSIYVTEGTQPEGFVPGRGKMKW